MRRAAYAVAALAVIAALPWLITTPYWRGILILCAMNVLLFETNGSPYQLGEP